MKARISEDFFRGADGSIADALIIQPDCECRAPLALQLAPLAPDWEAFKFDGDLDEPTVTHFSDAQAAGSALPPANRCGSKRCHFVITRGVAYHRKDSKYPNAVVPLLPLTSGTPAK